MIVSILLNPGYVPILRQAQYYRDGLSFNVALIPKITTKSKHDAKGWSIIKFYGKLMEGNSTVNGQGAIQG
jgi:hypothetical protein